MNKLLAESIGWYGAGAIILAYFLVSFGIMNADGLPYQLLNLTGAFGILIISLVKRVYQTVALNVIWAVIAAVALSKMVF